jgi:single-strand DNA-binding protein
MAVDSNLVVVVGRLTCDPELKDLGAKRVAEFGLAVNGFGDQVSFFDVSAWDKTADIIEKYAGKGKQVCVVGRLKQDTWEKDGQKRSKVSIIASQVQLLASKADGTQGTSPAAAEEDIPF